jgi:hypothetical protein
MYENTEEKQKSEKWVPDPKVESGTNDMWSCLVASNENLNHIYESPSIYSVLHLYVTSYAIMKIRGLLQVNLYRIEYRLLVMVTPEIYKFGRWLFRVET